MVASVYVAVTVDHVRRCYLAPAYRAVVPAHAEYDAAPVNDRMETPLEE